MKTINWKYALGEILIVIIGITIAFSLNKCTQKSENKKLSEMYLANLLSDLEQDKKNLEKNILTFETKRQKINELKKLLSSGQALDASHNMLVVEVSNLEKFKPNNVTYNTLLNSGDFKLIQDFELRKAIESHYNNVYSKISSEYERLENIHKVFLADYYIYHIDHGRFETNEFAFLETKLLFNILSSTQGASQLAIAASQSGAENCKQLIRLIEENMQ